MPVASQGLQSGMLFGAVGALREADQDPDHAKDSPRGMDQMVKGQVVVDREENSRAAVNAVREVPTEFEGLGDGIAEGDDEGSAQGQDGLASALIAQGVDRGRDQEAAGHHDEGNDRSGDAREALGPLLERFREMGAGDEIDGEHDREFDEFTGNPRPDSLVARKSRHDGEGWVVGRHGDKDFCPSMPGTPFWRFDPTSGKSIPYNPHGHKCVICHRQDAKRVLCFPQT